MKAQLLINIVSVTAVLNSCIVHMKYNHGLQFYVYNFSFYIELPHVVIFITCLEYICNFLFFIVIFSISI